MSTSIHQDPPADGEVGASCSESSIGSTDIDRIEWFPLPVNYNILEAIEEYHPPRIDYRAMANDGWLPPELHVHIIRETGLRPAGLGNDILEGQPGWRSAMEEVP